jgi:hypothetical protein
MARKEPFYLRASGVGAKIVKVVYFDAPKAAYKKGKR